MRADTVRFPVVWGLWEALWPLGVLAVVLWVASPALTVSWNVPFDATSPPAHESGSTPGNSTPGNLQMPVRGVTPSSLADTFTDPRPGGRTHHAIDIPASRGTPVVAAAAGVILKVTTERRGGRAVYQLAADSSRAFYYAHLSRVAGDVARGTRVEAGDVLGTVGATGNASGPHLHFAVWALDDLRPPWSDRSINPYPLLAEP